MYGEIKNFLNQELHSIEEAGLYKKERIIVSPQKAEIKLNTGEQVLNFCANNYLGLSDNPRVIEAAKKSNGFTWIRYVVCTFHLWYSRYT